MSRQDRRRFEKEFKKLPKGDNCMICGAQFPHNSKTFGGLTGDGRTVLAGECCSHRLAAIMVSGLYVTQLVDTLASLGKKGTVARSRGASPGNIDGAITAIQSHFADLGTRTDALMRQAGIQKPAKGLFLGEYPWKADDAAWFKNHPERSHRLRPVLEGEAEMVSANIPEDQIPPNHRVEIVVRQIEPGKRVRGSFCRNTELDIPDQEEVIHAIFDAVAGAAEGKVIDLRETLERARQYANSRAQRLN